MKPAFDNPRQALGFLLLLIATMLLPALAGPSALPPRKEVYARVPWAIGAFPYMEQQIFEEKGDIDIAFVGSSAVWWGIDAPEFQDALGKKLGRPAVVRSLCWNWNGFDSFYFIMRDLLAHRKVRVIAMHLQTEGTGKAAHTNANYLFRFGDDASAIAGLPVRSWLSFYACAISGMPQNLLGLLRENGPVTPSDEIAWTVFKNVQTPMQRLGALPVKRGWDKHGVYEDYIPPIGSLPSEAQIHPGGQPSQERFFESPLYPMQEHFVRKIADLAQAHGVKIVMLHMPHASDVRNPVLSDHQFWPTDFRPQVTWLGVPPAKLFEGMSDVGITRLFHDVWHMNYNGQRYFTRVIQDALIRIYETETQR